MNQLLQKAALSMIEYDQGDPDLIHHFLKVYAFASAIGQGEGLDAQTEFILETAALVHDIGIHLAVETYGSSAGRYQELTGPGEAELLLRGVGYPEDVIARVCYLVGHHHTYDAVDGPDYQILLEADFLVNLYENSVSPDGQREAYANIFRTETGRYLCRILYPAVA